MREAEMADLKKSFDEVKDVATGLASGNVMTALQKDVSDSLRIDDIDKPADTSSSTPAIEPPTTPTTPEAPTPATFVEAEAHAAADEPLAIVREVQQAAVAQDTAPAEALKDAKAS
jgi:sec-independent protein translocase protein TatB